MKKYYFIGGIFALTAGIVIYLDKKDILQIRRSYIMF